MIMDILFINCWSKEFPYIPMGTFGLCDYISQHDFNSKIINLSLYDLDQSDKILMNKIEETHPRYIGLILHWKESLSNVIRTGSLLREYFPEIPIVMGGITSSYFAIQLLENLKFVDYIIKGDAEIPLLNILNEKKRPEFVENLIYRKNGSIIHTRSHFLADKAILDNIYFSKLDFLIDYPLYLKKIDSYLGFPIFVGRGCKFDCEYCGGSKSAFIKHSERDTIVIRGINKIAQEIIDLINRYNCEHFLLSHFSNICKSVLQVLLSSPNIRGNIRLNLEFWDVPDEEVLELHEKLSKGIQIIPSVIITPKTGLSEVNYNSESKSERIGLFSKYLSLDRLIELSQYAHLDIFKGYFTSEQCNMDKLLTDLKEVHNIRRRYANRNVSVHFLAFSTDPASHLSETSSIVKSNLELDTIHQTILFDRGLSTNILLHRPESISLEDQKIFEKILFLSEHLFLKVPFIYWLLTESFGFEKYLSIIKHASQNYFYDIGAASYEISPSNSILALNCIKRIIEKNEKENEFIIDVLNLWIKYEVSKRLRRLTSNDTNVLPKYLTLNQDRIFISHYNHEKLLIAFLTSGYIDKSLIKKSIQIKEPSFYIFKSNSLNRLPIEEFHVLQMFNGIVDTPAHIKKLTNKKSASLSWVEKRIRKLYEENLLIDI